MTRSRRIATLLHRYVGLGLALFLTIVGLTGATIAWNDELERLFAPTLFVLPAAAAARQPLDPFALREAAARAVAGFAVNGVDFTRAPGQPALFNVEARPGGPEPRDTEIALDPSTGTIVGARRHGDLRQGAINLMPFIYDLHDSLALGETGVLVLGIVALAWTIDCFVGAYLTFPARGAAAPWLARWRRSWTIRRFTAAFRMIFDLHRAGGLWLWGMLFVLAWSSVGFNLPTVYAPVMQTVFGAAAETPVPAARPAGVPPRLDWRQAHATAQAAMRAIARREGFTIESERLMFYDPASHVYSYRVRSDRDPGWLGNTQVRIDGDDGRVVAVDIPTGRRAGDTVTTWLGELHTAGVFGTAWKVLLTVVGLGVAMLSITGVLIWLRKRSSRLRSAPSRRTMTVPR